MIILHRKFPPGGLVGQFLRKCSSTDNDVEWANIPSGSSLPDGGTTGQALRKASNADQDVSWQNDPDPFPSGGSTGQVLTKTASGRAWQDNYFIQTGFSDWSSQNLTLNSTKDIGFNLILKYGNTTRSSLYASEVCQRSYSNNLSLILKLKINGQYIITPVSLVEVMQLREYNLSFVLLNNVRYLNVFGAQVTLR